MCISPHPRGKTQTVAVFRVKSGSTLGLYFASRSRPSGVSPNTSTKFRARVAEKFLPKRAPQASGSDASGVGREARRKCRNHVHLLDEAADNNSQGAFPGILKFRMFGTGEAWECSISARHGGGPNFVEIHAGRPHFVLIWALGVNFHAIPRNNLYSKNLAGHALSPPATHEDRGDVPSAVSLGQRRCLASFPRVRSLAKIGVTGADSFEEARLEGLEPVGGTGLAPSTSASPV